MTITAKVIAKSRSPFHHMGVPDITTFLLRYPRYIHPEFLTHRVFSRNASSSRAIPVERLIQDVMDDPVIPLHWGRNQRGMQADHEQDTPIYLPTPALDLDDTLTEMDRREAWLAARDCAVGIARAFAKAGYHKQVVNRLLEPFAHINVVVTATSFDNFYWLRNHPDAQPEIKALAQAMLAEDRTTAPRVLGAGEWHLPFVSDEDRACVRLYYTEALGVVPVEMSQEELRKVSTARCARTSYMTHDGRVPDLEEDVALHDRLVVSEPLHASPAEHQAQPDVPNFGDHTIYWAKGHLSGNFDQGWIQHRKTLPRENCTTYDRWCDTSTIAA